jgi:hypothetical protein
VGDFLAGFGFGFDLDLDAERAPLDDDGALVRNSSSSAGAVRKMLRANGLDE